MIENYAELREFIANAEGMGFVMPAKAKKIVACVDSVRAPQGTAAEASDGVAKALASVDSAAFAKSLDMLVDATAKRDAAAEVAPFVQSQAFGPLRESVVPALWTFARDRFNAAGKGFADAWTIIDPDTTVTIESTVTERERTAYLRAPELVGELDAFARLLADIIMQLTGPHTFRFRRQDTEEWAALCVRMGDAHPRRVVESWAASPALGQIDSRRGRRWSEIVRLGAIIETVDTPSDFWPLELPDIIHVHSNRGLVKTVVESIDPLDSEEAAARAAEFVEFRLGHGQPTGETVVVGTPLQRPAHLPPSRLR